MKYAKELSENGSSYNFKFKGVNIRFLNLKNHKERNMFLFQFNRFENGYCDIYLRYFGSHSLIIDGIKLSEGKRVFIGQTEK